MATASMVSDAEVRENFTASHPADRDAVAIGLAGAWFGLLAGFIPDMIAALAEGYHYVPATHAHAASAVAWMSLLTWQALQVRRQRIADHRRIGRAVGPWLALAVVVSAFATVIMADRAKFDAGTLNLPRVAFQFGHLVPFAVLTTLALSRTADPAAHKRLMLLGMFAVIDAGWSRWLMSDITAVVGEGLVGQMLGRFPLTWALMLGMALYDWRTRGRLHPVFLPAAGFAVATEFGSAWLYFSPWWPGVAQRIIGF